jgi:hypothetical protein
LFFCNNLTEKWCFEFLNMMLNERTRNFRPILRTLQILSPQCFPCLIFFNVFLTQYAVLQLKKCVAYPQEDFLFIKLITSFRISLLNNCKKYFQFHIKTTQSNFFYTINIRFFLHDLFEFHVFGLSRLPVAFQTS